MIWKEGRFKNHVANLGNGLTLIVQYSNDPEGLHKDLCWEVIVFGKKQDSQRTIEDAKLAAAGVAESYLRDALRVLEGE